MFRIKRITILFMSALLMGSTVCTPIMAAEESGEPIASVQQEATGESAASVQEKAEEEKQPESENEEFPPFPVRLRSLMISLVSPGFLLCIGFAVFAGIMRSGQ